MMKINIKLIAVAALSLLGLCSCFQVESTITVNKDGSGTIVEKMILGQQMKSMMAMAPAQKGKDPMAQMLSAAKAEARAKKMGEGVELVSVEKIDANGQLGVKTTFKFSDVNKLDYAANSAMGNAPTNQKKKVDDDSGMAFHLSDGKLTITLKEPEAKNVKKVADKKPDPQMLAAMQEAMRDMRVTTRIKIASGIAKTDATYVEGDTITIMDMPVGKIVSDPEKFKVMMTGDFNKTKKALKNVEGVKFEQKDAISIEMK